MVERGEARADPGAVPVDRPRDTLGHLAAQPRFELRLDGGRLLAGHQPEGHLGVRLGRDDRLVALALVAAPHAVDLGGRTGPDPLEGRVAGLAARRGAVGVGEPCALVVGQLADQRALVVGQLQHAVVEAVDGDVQVVVVHPAQQPRELGKGVGDRAAEGP